MRLADESSPDAAGQSAQREYERRDAARRKRARARYGPLVGSLFASITVEPSVQAWQQGAGGELETARQLSRLLGRSGVILIHDRRIPGRGRANIDHLAIGPGGITLIDTKSSRGRVQIATVGVFNRRQQLLVNGRDRTRQLDAVERQIADVSRALDRAGVEGVGVLGALCYPFMRRPPLHYNRARDGLITVDDPRRVAKIANRAGPLSSDEIERLADILLTSFPPAA
jgi:hypothetical protein